MGRTNYGDSVDDEWLIVYLLREISRRFPEAWIRIVDSDGEFLLIEAASALPSWLEPEIADNRVRMISADAEESCANMNLRFGLIAESC